MDDRRASLHRGKVERAELVLFLALAIAGPDSA
jgi:hypothetical protein